MIEKHELQRLHYKLVSIFGKHTFIQTMQAWRPERILEFLNTLDTDCNTVVLQDELWRYPDLDSTILSHPNLQNKKVYIITTGYKNTAQPLGQLSFPNYFIVGTRLNADRKVNIRPTKLQFGFNCLNNRPAPHRILLGYRLFESNLLDQVLFTQSAWDSMEADIFNSLPNFKTYKQLLPIALPDSNDGEDARSKGPLVYHHSFYNSYCNIVTETETEEVPYTNKRDLENITEKSYKPFIAKQVPLILGCRGHVAYLKGLGFEMMEDLLPLGYDRMWTEQKITAIVDIVARGRDYIEDFYFSHLREIEHNYELYLSGKVEQIIFKRIQDQIN